VIVHRKVCSLRNADAFDAWLYRIVMRESVRVRRRLEPTGQRLFDGFIENDSAMTLDVWRALAALPPALRDVTVLFYFDDLKSHEIAAILGIEHATVRTRLARAREHLHGLLEDYGDDPRPAPKEVQQHGV